MSQRKGLELTVETVVAPNRTIFSDDDETLIFGPANPTDNSGVPIQAADQLTRT